MIQTRDIHWLTGLLEGEGCFHTPTNTRHGIMLSLLMTDKDVVHRAATIMGAKVIHHQDKRPNRKKAYRFQLTGKRAASWMMTLCLLLGKRRKAKVIEAIRLWRKQAIRNVITCPGCLSSPKTHPFCHPKYCHQCYKKYRAKIELTRKVAQGLVVLDQ